MTASRSTATSRPNYAAGTVDFDVAWNHTSFMSQYTNFVEPLQDYFTAEELAAFSPSIIEAATIDGNLQLIPRHADISAHVLPHRPLRVTRTCRPSSRRRTATRWHRRPRSTRCTTWPSSSWARASSTYGTQFAGQEEALAGRFYELLFANGGDYFDADLNPIFDSEAGVLSATWMQDLYANGLIPADTPNLRVGRRQPANFCNGDVAFYLEWYGWYGYFQDPESCPDVAGKFGMVRGPVGAARATSTPAGPVRMPSAWPRTRRTRKPPSQLIKFLTSEAVEFDESNTFGVLPVRADVSARVEAANADTDNPLDAERWELAEPSGQRGLPHATAVR